MYVQNLFTDMKVYIRFGKDVFRKRLWQAFKVLAGLAQREFKRSYTMQYTNCCHCSYFVFCKWKCVFTQIYLIKEPSEVFIVFFFVSFFFFWEMFLLRQWFLARILDTWRTSVWDYAGRRTVIWCISQSYKVSI